jgi:hypothetical protein
MRRLLNKQCHDESYNVRVVGFTDNLKKKNTNYPLRQCDDLTVLCVPLYRFPEIAHAYRGVASHWPRRTERK